MLGSSDHPATAFATFVKGKFGGCAVLAASGLLYAVELLALCFFVGIGPAPVALFLSFFLLHFFLTGIAVALIAARLTTTDGPIFNIIVIGVVADAAILLLCWRLDILQVYALYPIATFVLLLLRPGWISRYGLTLIHHDAPLTRCLLVAQVIPPLLWLFSLDVTDGHFMDQIFGVQSVSHWPPPNLVVADVPYSNNYVLHLLLSVIRAVTQIDLVLLVTRLSPIFLSWMFARALYHFCVRYLGMPAAIALLPGLCFFITFGYSPVVGHIFGTPTITASIWVQSPLLSFSILLLVVAIQSALPQAVPQRSLILFSAFVSTYVATGARAQLGPIVICGQLLLLGQAVLSKKMDVIRHRASVLAVMLVSVLTAIAFFLTVTSGFTGVSFLTIEANPTHFILENLTWFYVGHWLSELGLHPTWAAAFAFLVIVVLQSSFLLPGFVRFLAASLTPGFTSLRPAKVVLLGIVIAGTSAVFLTEAPGGSHYVFLHYSKIAAIVLGAVGLSEYSARTGQNNKGWAIGIIGGTALLAAVHLADTCVQIYHSGRAGIAKALQPRELPDAEHVSELSQVLSRYGDRNASVFVYYSGLAKLGAYLLPVQFGLQTIGDVNILAEYAKWESYAKTALQRRRCLLNAFDAAVKSGVVDGNLIHALGKTLLGRYEAIYVVVPAETKVSGLETFEIRDGPHFSVFRLPTAAIEQSTFGNTGCIG